MAMIAYAFLQHRRLATAKQEKKNRWTAAAANSASSAVAPSLLTSLQCRPDGARTVDIGSARHRDQ
jgi:hypothetical protein